VERTPAAGPPDTPAIRITLLRAWREAAFRPSRHTFETLAAVADRRWVVASLLVSLTLIYLSWALLWLAARAGLPALSSSSTARPVQSPGEAAVYQLLLTPATFVFGVLATIYLVAHFAPPARGSIGVRFQQVLRPYVLAQVPSACAEFIIRLLPTSNASLTDPSHVALGCFNALAGLAAVSYGIVLTVNSLSAGSGRSRWAVFILFLLAAVLALALTQVVPALLARLFGVHLLPYDGLFGLFTR
jgi:hypothetical protein